MEILVIVRDDCPFCDMASEALDKHGLKYRKVIVNGDRREIYEKLSEFTGHQVRTVPQILWRAEDAWAHIGGCDALMDRGLAVLQEHNRVV